MNITVCKTPDLLGNHAAALAAGIINRAVQQRGEARVVLSTGNSQLETLQHLLRQDIDWGRVVFFHLDEYVGLPEAHPASFRRYLRERVFCHTPGAVCHVVNGEVAQIPALTALLREKPIDLGLIGIGENAHIAFNDPPADFATTEAYICVNLDERCKRQQVNEGWFATLADVPAQAISMTVHQILQCKSIISSVPHAAKAKAVADTLQADITNAIPATILKQHPEYHLVLDSASAALVRQEQIHPAPGVGFAYTMQ